MVARVGNNLYDTSSVLATVEPDLSVAGSLYIAIDVSERTTLTASTGRKCHGREYGGGAGLGAGAASAGLEATCGGSSAFAADEIMAAVKTTAVADM